MRLDFFDIQLFLHVVDCGSLTKAAQRSSISLQAASERIKKLEQHYQVSLFTRHHNGVQLSAAGQSFAEHALRLKQQYLALQDSMQAFSGRRRFCLWCNSSAQSEYLPDLLPQYLLDHPQFQIELKEAESLDIIQAIQQGHAELGIISSFFAHQHLQSRPFADDPLVLICATQHPLAQATQLDLNQVLSYPFVGLMAHHSLQRSIEHQAQQLGYQIQYRLRLPTFSAIHQVVANGVGIAIVPRRATQHLRAQKLHVIALTGAWAQRQLLLVAHDFAKLNPDYANFAHYLSQHNPP
ncbi:LysR family transcriptional regulator [Acinetobacter larvae]|uniref:Transcriptional regulator n=1 Tax=Acinetobacter larvae TaxID=1789224 RepID=A0A1B2LVJ0_9GAMM|nr:LysR family transcriptional regulator [Acinetobacter larvae]AOA56935.1 transcriptional regulator [Acinetobacter larvae]